MPRFRCFFIDWSDKVGGFEPCECESEGEAMNRAVEMLRARPEAAAVELWESGIFIARIPRLAGRERA